MAKRPTLDLKKPKPVVDRMLDQETTVIEKEKPQSKEGGKKSIKVFMDLSSHENLRIYCVKAGKTLNEFLFEAINMRLEKENAGFTVSKP